MQCHGLARLLCPWNSLGKNTGVGCHSLLQGIFLTQGSNLCPLHCRQFLYHLSHQGSPNSFLVDFKKSTDHSVCLVIQSCSILWDPIDCSPPGSSVHGDSSGKKTGVGCHFLFQGIFPTQGSNLCLLYLLHCRLTLYHLSHKGRPHIYATMCKTASGRQLYSTGCLAQCSVMT